MALHTDPVCGMQVDPARAAATHEHAGRTFYFCCDGCRDRFAIDPGRYAAALPPTGASLPAPAVSHAPGSARHYTCPMHPEVVRPGPGACPICGMALEPAGGDFPDGGDTHGDGGQSGAAPADPEERDMTRRLFWGAVCTAPLLLLAMGGMLPGAPAWLERHARVVALVQWLLATPVVVVAGRPLWQRGWTSVRTLRFNMFTLIAAGIGVSYGYSVIATLVPGLLPPTAPHGTGHAPVYFETAAVITLLVLLGQVLELRARHKTGDALRRLVRLRPPRTLRRDPSGVEQEIPVEQVRPGDLLRLRPGDAVPVDGVVVEGRGGVDESLLTGEPLPVDKGPDDRLTGGSINGSGSLLMRAERVGADTVLAGIVRLVAEAQRSRAPIQRMADAVSAWFVPAVLLVAAATFLAWALVGPEPRIAYAVLGAVSVLIIACPCALGLATPMSIMVAAGRGARAGVLFRNAEAIERLARVGLLVIDKTGTLTEGRPTVTSIHPAPGMEGEVALLRLAAAVEQRSEHPLASAIIRAARERNIAIPEPTGFRSFAGQGTVGLVDGVEVAVGSRSFLRDRGCDIGPDAPGAGVVGPEEAGKTVVWIAVAGKPGGSLGITDPLREGAAPAVSALRSDRLDIVMATGDSRPTALAVAARLGIERVEAGLLPGGKQDLVRRLQSGGAVVAMAGDGVNDAPALAAADVGIALGTGSGVAIGSSAVTLMHGDLEALVRARRLSRATLANIRQNLFFAFAYNALCIPVAAGVFYPRYGWLLSPMLAAAAMSLSSVTVIANALRLRRIRL